ncbi:MAG: MerR family transcriptional regulator [Candidatus Hydrothermales bacterium]
MREKYYYTIKEVSEITEVKPHVIRYWESQIPALRPKKIRGRRFYTIDDINLIKLIKKLHYNDGLTLEGVKKKILSIKDKTQIDLPLEIDDRKLLREIKNELIKIIDFLKS